MPVSWYAIKSKPNKESFLAGQLESHDVEIFFPCVQVIPANPRSRKIRPYFPGYLFVHVDLDLFSASDLRWMPGASGLVSFDGEPAPVPDIIITAIKKHLDHYNQTFQDQGKMFQQGDSVQIQNGPFAGYEAIFDTHISGPDRVRVLLNLLQSRKVPVEIDSRQIRRAKR